MADEITLKALQDASVDAKSLEEVVNGNETKQVTTRLGESYPSVKKAINIMFENGGLPAVPFATKALMTASALANDKYAMVTDDTVNNGLYIKTAGAWFKSTYDPLEQAKAYTDTVGASVAGSAAIDATGKSSAAQTNAVSESKTYTDGRVDNEILQYLGANGSTATLLNVLDVNGISVLSLDKEGGLHCYDIEGTVQDELNKLGTRVEPIFTKPVSGDLFRVVDSNDNPLMRINSDGDLQLGADNETVQSKLARIGEPESKPLYYKKSENLLSGLRLDESCLARVSNAKAMNMHTSPVPHFSVKQTMDIGTAWINNVTMVSNASEDRVIIDGYDPMYREDIGVVHPQVWSFNEPVLGYKYWLSINPYSGGNPAIELPFIYGTNNPSFRQWELIPNIPTPFEDDPVAIDGVHNGGFLSDSGFTYDVKTGDFVFFWRRTIYSLPSDPVTSRLGLFASRFNGVEWSENHTLREMKNQSGVGSLPAILSPNIVYNPTNDLFYMYSINSAGNLQYQTSPDITADNWSDSVICTTDTSVKFWHLDVKMIGNQVVALLHSDHIMMGGEDAYYFAVSSDFTTFTVATNSIITNANPELYKPTFMPIFTSANTVKFRIIYTSDDQSNPQYRLYVSDTNEITLGA